MKPHSEMEHEDERRGGGEAATRERPAVRLAVSLEV
jgi:hypothetical protein